MENEKKYEAIKKIVDERQYAKVDGVTVDGFTASMLLQICDNLSPQNRDKFLSMPIRKMVDVGWKLTKTSKTSTAKNAGRMKELAMLKDELSRLSEEFDYLLENDPDNKNLHDLQKEMDDLRHQLQRFLPKLKASSRN
jgi:hypothetical protein